MDGTAPALVDSGAEWVRRLVRPGQPQAGPNDPLDQDPDLASRPMPCRGDDLLTAAGCGTLVFDG
jgi:hypothetical protein